jgi:16S rRNA (guanine(966)-N(2))-methyltransferase RsmD
MRIIAGTWRGREILGPIGTTTRPVLDRVKGAIFDILGSRLGLPGQLPPIAVLDLFCGTGSMGLEALSRGARRCHFVDRDRSAVKLLRQNIDTLGARECAFVSSASGKTVDLALNGPYDLAFVDPPYPLSRDVSAAGIVPIIFNRLRETGVVTPEIIIVCRHEDALIMPNQMAGFATTNRRTFNKMAVTFFGNVKTPDVSEGAT